MGFFIVCGSTYRREAISNGRRSRHWQLGFYYLSDFHIVNLRRRLLGRRLYLVIESFGV